MKTNIFNTAAPKFKNLSFSELLDRLSDAKDPRSKSPILITLSALQEKFDNKKLFDAFLIEACNKANIETREFATLTVAMIAAIGIIKMQNINYIQQLISKIQTNWNEKLIEDFRSILKNEMINVDI